MVSGEGENLSRGDGIASTESDELGSLVVFRVGGLFPDEFDGERLRVGSGEISDFEDGGEHSASEGRSSGDGLLLVASEREGSSKEGLDSLLERGNSSGSTDQFDGFNLILLDSGLGESSLEGGKGSLEERGDESFEFLSLEGGGSIDVLHDGFDGEGSDNVGREDLLELLDGGRKTEESLLVAQDVDLVLLLELGREMLDEGVVEIPTSKVSVVGGRFNNELSLVEGNDRDGVVGVSNIDEGDVLARLLDGGKVGLGDSVSQSGRGGVVDETEGVESSDFGGVDDGSSLDLGVPDRDSDDNVVDGGFELARSSVLESSEEHGVKLSRREDGGLSEVLNLERNSDQLPRSSSNLL